MSSPPPETFRNYWRFIQSCWVAKIRPPPSLFFCLLTMCGVARFNWIWRKFFFFLCFWSNNGRGKVWNTEGWMLDEDEYEMFRIFQIEIFSCWILKPSQRETPRLFESFGTLSEKMNTFKEWNKIKINPWNFTKSVRWYSLNRMNFFYIELNLKDASGFQIWFSIWVIQKLVWPIKLYGSRVIQVKILNPKYWIFYRHLK